MIPRGHTIPLPQRRILHLIPVAVPGIRNKDATHNMVSLNGLQCWTLQLLFHLVIPCITLLFYGLKVNQSFEVTYVLILQYSSVNCRNPFLLCPQVTFIYLGAMHYIWLLVDQEAAFFSCIMQDWLQLRYPKGKALHQQLVLFEHSRCPILSCWALFWSCVSA